MADAAVSFAIEKLANFLTQEVNIRIGVKDGVNWLRDELGYLLVSVRVAEEHAASMPKPKMDLIRQWINNVKDVANDAVIILERFSTLQHEGETPKQGVLYRMWNVICMFCKKEANLYDIGKEIESLKGRVVEIKNRHEQYGITNILTTPIVHQRKRPLLKATSFEHLVDVVGFKDDVNILLAELLKEDPSLNMISIHGMGGSGKTTLASKLYHSSELSHFQSRAWVCVSQEYDIKDVLNKMIKSLQGYEVDLSKMDEVDSLRHLRKSLKDCGCYLAVIDDIWDIEVWEKIKKALPDKKNGSRVIVTTRNKKIAQKIDDRCFVNEIRFLKEDESWELFCKRAKPARNLESLGKEMVSKCGGLPLAIVVLSGLLLNKKSSDWFKVKDRMWRQLKSDSVEIEQILSLSYADLSFQMRQCFLYLARFPEDHRIQVNELKLLWIAEEFISEADEAHGLVMEDVAEDYLNELVNRNMIQIVELLWDGQVQECRVHDLVRDLVIQKAAEEKLLGTFDSKKLHPTPIRLLQGQPRHVIHNGISKYLELIGSSSDDVKLHSLALINQLTYISNLEVMMLLYTRFKYLRVLVLTAVKTKRIPEEIGDLVLLKFLGLVGSYSSETLVIPSSICELKKLQTLCGAVNECYELPKDICDLKELRHLYFSYGVQFKQGVVRGSLNSGKQHTKLQTIEYILYEAWIRIDTPNLTNLVTLGIRAEGKSGASSLESIAYLASLQTFSLYAGRTVLPTLEPLSSCQHLKNVILRGEIRDPSILQFLPDSVTDLTLIDSMLVQDLMPTLGSFPNLTHLHLNRVYKGSRMVSGDDAFPSLQLLKFEYLRNLKEWHIEVGAMPSLKYLTIENCPCFEMVPRLEHLPSIPTIYSPWNRR
ncbi:putative disease resistance RPP13-like protein 3 [Apium graveolens]|uniref:putative disease resistance RPP13-like protein 3 n=1 Tax=Apium graveolens TaxID=4045 RepID=UPI003D7BCDD7